MSVAGLLLAAGEGRRFGGPKALIELDGEPLVRRGIRLLIQGGCDPVVVVLGAAAERVAPLCEGVEVVVAEQWHSGMGASLRAGLAALDGRADACIVALADQPLVSADSIRLLLAAPGPAAVASYEGRRRNPVRLDAAVWADVAAAAVGDEGARGWLRDHPEQVFEVDCTGTGSPDDIDTPADLIAVRARTSDPDPEVVAR